MTPELVRIDKVAGLAEIRLVPEISGAAISAHRLNSDWSSVAVMPLPISSMSGSFQPPGPANCARVTLEWKIDSMLAKLAVMSPVVRHMFPVAAPQVQTDSWPQLDRLNTMCRPVAARASRMAVYRVWAAMFWLLQ